MYASEPKARSSALYHSFNLTKEGYVALLEHGLEKLGTEFFGRLCYCGGTGERRTMFTAGCGGGYYTGTEACPFCNGTGVVQWGEPAPDSVVVQILNTGYYDGISNPSTHNPPWAATEGWNYRWSKW